MYAPPVSSTYKTSPLRFHLSRGWTMADSALTAPDFWGPVSNFGIPVAAIADMQKDPEFYGGREEALKLKAQAGAQTIQKEGKNMLQQGEEKLKEVKDKVVR
ncbi:MAG: hypothetical protein Q9212_000311 [Teloschistes hypoglaucus]